jgi:lipoprotein Spr
LNFTSNKQITPVHETEKLTKFIDEIAESSVKVQKQEELEKTEPKSELTADVSDSLFTISLPDKQDVNQPKKEISTLESEIENASQLHLKYAVLLNTEVEYLPSKKLLESVDKWYGVRYRSGGNDKNGIDCSGFTVSVYSAVFGIMLPRVSREQHRISRKISVTELQQGDLVFFNTRGRGVSHVGIYLGNNKFIHASISKGVIVNDLFEPYYLKRYVGSGRIEGKQILGGEN